MLRAHTATIIMPIEFIDGRHGEQRTVSNNEDAGSANVLILPVVRIERHDDGAPKRRKR